MLLQLQKNLPAAELNGLEKITFGYEKGKIS